MHGMEADPTCSVGGVSVFLLELDSPKRDPNEHFWDAQLPGLVDIGDGAESAGIWHRVTSPFGHIN